MNLKDTLKSASSNLWRNKGRTILTIIAIFIGAFTISVTTGINNGVNDYIDKQVSNIGRKDQLSVMKKVDDSMGQTDAPKEYDDSQGGSEDEYTMTDKDVAQIETVKGLSSVQPTQSFSTDYIQTDGKKYVFTASAAGGIHVDLKAGKQVAEKGDAYQIALAPDYVKSLGFKSAKDALGKKVKVAASSQATKQQEVVEATIVGVRNPSIVNNGQSIVSHALAEKLMEINNVGLPPSMQGQFYYLNATVADPTEENLNAIKEKLDKKGYVATTFEDELGTLHSTVNAITGVLTLFGAIALLAASFGIINTLYMSVQDRTREIGLMKAMGMSRGKVFLSFSVEALLIGFWGSVLGVIGAMGAGQLLNKVATDSFLKGLDGFRLVEFSVPSVLMIILIIMLIAFLAGTMPANRAARLDPIEALRYE